MLPELPRIIKKREANITPKVLAWFRKNYPYTCAIEIKATNSNSIPKSAVMDHQMKALLQAESPVGIVHKLSDEARRKQPFDAFCIKGCKAYVVACFTGRGICYVIPANEWSGANVKHPQGVIIDV